MTTSLARPKHQHTRHLTQAGDHRDPPNVAYNFTPAHVKGQSTMYTSNSDPQFRVLNLHDAKCVDCSTVTSETEWKKHCMHPTNRGWGQYRFAACSTKAQRDVDHNRGNEQVDSYHTGTGALASRTSSRQRDARVGYPTGVQLPAGTQTRLGGPDRLGLGQPADKHFGKVAPAGVL